MRLTCFLQGSRTRGSSGRGRYHHNWYFGNEGDHLGVLTKVCFFFVGVSSLGTCARSTRQAIEICTQTNSLPSSLNSPVPLSSSSFPSPPSPSLSPPPVTLACTAGLHPHSSRFWTPALLKEIDELSGHPSVVAIGECGLDLERNFSPFEKQSECLRDHIRSLKCRNPTLVG